MDRLLQNGDVFTFKNPENASLCGKIKYRMSDGKPTTDFSIIGFDLSDECRVSWTEKKADGWERNHNLVLVLKVPKRLENQKWRVVATASTGGGNNGRPGDDFPNGHCVLAKLAKQKKFGSLLKFYQSGCFVGVVTPNLVTLVK